MEISESFMDEGVCECNRDIQPLCDFLELVAVGVVDLEHRIDALITDTLRASARATLSGCRDHPRMRDNPKADVSEDGRRL